MADVTRRDAMSISSLLAEPQPDSEPDAAPRPAPAPAPAAPARAPAASSAPAPAVLARVAPPADARARACAEQLVARLDAVQRADAAAETQRLAERLNRGAARARDEADVFVAYAYPALVERAEARAAARRGTSAGSAGSAADDEHAPTGRKRRRDDFVVLVDEPRVRARPRRPLREKAGAHLEAKPETDFVPIAPAATAASASAAPASKRRRAAAAAAAAAAASGSGGADDAPAPSKRRAKKGAPVTPEPDASSASEAEVPTKKQALAAQRRERQYTNTYEGIWRDIARKDIPKAYKFYGIGNSVKLSNCRKTATLAAKEARKWQLNTNRHVKDMQTKARRAMREMLGFWKRNEKEERDSRKRAEKEALDSARRQEEERESRRQARKLNFLITQTELYSHFVGSKDKSGDAGADADADAAADATANATANATADAIADAKMNANMKIDAAGEPTAAAALDFDAADDSDLRRAAAANAQKAVATARSRAQAFDRPKPSSDDDFQNPTSLGSETIAQPKLLSCQLKGYQLKGLTWLANLYEQGINGILADEMGLGKTVQSISVMAYLAEKHDIWGPFLVVAPASTLHNWQQEVSKFVPEFKVLPYWGSNKDRKVLRKFWDRKQLRYSRDSPFHVLITSYQLVVADAQYFNRIKWQYMILDEAQAIKSSSSSRWKSLLGLQCRNRLLLTGTPIQNSMQELWALLHFIMPTLFDSHEEFSDWFSKDIESHATKNSQLNEAQLKRLHMILKPFMLRRIKRHVQQELGEKIELDLYCNLTPRQKVLYRLVKSQISIRDLIEKGSSGDDAASLMNLVMQFRKVCNHPDLFERQDVISAFSFATFGQTMDIARESSLSVAATSRNCIELGLPRLFVTESGMLDVPGPHSSHALRRRVLRDLSVVDATNDYVKSVSKFSGTPAGEIVRLARQGLYERAVDSAPDLLKIVPDAPICGVFDSYLAENYVMAIEPAFHDRVTAPPVSLFVPERSFYTHRELELRPLATQALFPLTLNEEWRRSVAGIPAGPGYYPDNGRAGFSTISVPSMPKFIADSGKLKKLDELLVQLKRDDHRVLIYFQMTRMMDLMEEYLTFRQYKYVRLDGSSKLGDRRDLVNDWQTRPELFVFLLSTRAGGLGINLTAADTVIFYDSDWNPTIDSQAMDRAHRLGQTRQVTVYRLLVRGTIEERMRNRAKQKEQVQAVVMEGSKAAVAESADKSAAPQGKDVAYWLLDEDESK